MMEIIYHLMWADGLIKLNRKAFTAVLGVGVTGGGTLGATCQMCPRLLLGLLLGPEVPQPRVPSG